MKKILTFTAAFSCAFAVGGFRAYVEEALNGHSVIEAEFTIEFEDKPVA